jgi:hypothetical protein
VFKSECVSCHDNLGNHNPTAPNCASCHLFTRAK